MFSKILIANRGEVAVRIIRACKEMGIATVAVYSTADADALHVAMADSSFCIGGADAADSYLNEERIISAAMISGAQAIHPGYGFLSESAHFAEQCLKNGLVFIGPSADNMRSLSGKEETKRRMSEAGLKVIPGTGVLGGAEDAEREAERIGYPVMLKARSGGGGRGIRLVRSPGEMERDYYAAVSEAKSSFGDGAVYMEKYIYPAKHIEVQIIADERGNVVCLGERDCSIQRNNQKLIEESPSPMVTAEQRRELFDRIVRAVKNVGYVGVGTLEFLMSGGEFYFMEMNIRLQVEHTVTEELTRIDLVKWQIRVAAGIPLKFARSEPALYGSAMECRINALSPGTVGTLHVPGGPFVRFDTCLVTGLTISPYYDPLIGKLIVYAGTREEALRKMQAALCELVVGGIRSNIAEQIDIVADGRFRDGSYDLSFFSKI